MKISAPIEPTDLVRSIFEDRQLGTTTKRSRYLQRLTPATLIGKATEKGIEDLARAVTQPILGEGCPKKQVRFSRFNAQITRNLKGILKTWRVTESRKLIYLICLVRHKNNDSKSHYVEKGLDNIESRSNCWVWSFCKPGSSRYTDSRGFIQGNVSSYRVPS